MATTRIAQAVWNGSLMEGEGEVTLKSSGVGSYPVTWPARAETSGGVTSPEELLAAAHATCFSMALSHGLAGAGTPPVSLRTRAEVDFQPGEGITGIKLIAAGDVPGLDADGFAAAAEDAKNSCPVSQALKAVPISLEIESI